MNGLYFAVEPPMLAPDPNRTDIACFVGFVARRGRNGRPTSVSADMTSAPEAIGRWFLEQRLVSHAADARLRTLEDLPVPIDTWDVFDQLFAWEARPVDASARVADTYLGAAVRSFFVQGGRKCFVVRVGDPWPYLSDMAVGGSDLTPQARSQLQRALRMAQLLRVVPGYRLPEAVVAAIADVDASLLPTPLEAASPLEPSTWRGIAAMLAAPEISFLCVPDLCDALAMEPGFIEQPLAPAPPEQFVECTSRIEEISTLRSGRPLRAPRCDELGFDAWRRVTTLVRDFVAQWQREVQFIAAIPLPASSVNVEREVMRPLDINGSAFVQLAYPWVRCKSSSRLPEQLAGPDAVVTGVLARNALTRGAFASAAGLDLIGVNDVFPPLSRAESRVPNRALDKERNAPLNLIERVSLMGRTASGMQLLSDVTTSNDVSYRPAAVNRLVSLLVRAARRLGDELLFEANGEALWARLAARMNDLMITLWEEGALSGKTARDAFDVRCDRSTMTQNDIDNGRLVASIAFRAVASIEVIAITLALNEGGQVSLINREQMGLAA